jgi:hypothetical protein
LSLSKGNPSLFLFYTMKFSICTAKNITENKKKEFRKDVSFPKLKKMALLLGRNEGNRQVSSRSFYYYLLLYPFFCFRVLLETYSMIPSK